MTHDTARSHDSQEQTLASFDYQWAALPSGDFMPGDPWFDRNATHVLAKELCAIAPSWFAGRRVLDAGCGRGRWTRALLELGATVTAVDFSQMGLDRTRELAGPTSRLVTQRENLLDISPELRAQRFDLVFSFGVLHHTGDTWKALDNVSSLVGSPGALFLYLYGATSWDAQHQADVEGLRRALAPLSFEQKIVELKQRFPNEDPHQLFDLLSPTINDRVRIEEVSDRLRKLGFDQIEQTIVDTEVYLRASRGTFPSDALLAPVGSRSEYLTELRARFGARAGATAEAQLRRAVLSVPRRATSQAIRDALGVVRAGDRVLDVSFAPDAIDRTDVSDARVDYSPALSPLQDAFRAFEPASVVVFAGAALGAGRFPTRSVEQLAGALAPDGHLILEFPERILATDRSVVDRLRDYGRAVPEKFASLLRRRTGWSSGQALSALGGHALLSPVPREAMNGALERSRLEPVRWIESVSRATVVVARRSA